MNIKKNLLSIIAVSSLIFLAGCNWFKKEEKTELYVINVLDKNLYDDCHIKGSINVPFEDVEKFAETLDKNSHIVLYCSNYMCTASGSSVKLLKGMGFKNVWAYEAGMAEWYEESLKDPNLYPIEGSCNEAYLKLKLEKPTEEDKEVPHITTQELSEKIKNMQAL